MKDASRTRIQCPHCDGEIYVRASVLVDDIQGSPEFAHDRLAQWRAGLTEDQRIILQRAQGTGLLSAFTQAVERFNQLFPNSAVKTAGMERFFLTYLKASRPALIPRFALDELKRLFPGHKIGSWSANGIIGITASGAIRMFMPSVIVTGLRVRGFNSSGASQTIAANENDLNSWIKTKYGYVPGEGEFMDMLRKKSIGEFALPVQ